MTAEEVIAEQEKEIAALKEAQVVLAKENGDLKIKIQESDSAKKKEASQVKITECLKSVRDIPAKSIERIAESLKETIAEEKDIQPLVEAAVKKERDYLLALTEGKSIIKGLGDTKGDEKGDAKKNVEAELKEARMKTYRDMGKSAEEIEKLEKV